MLLETNKQTSNLLPWWVRRVWNHRSTWSNVRLGSSTCRKQGGIRLFWPLCSWDSLLGRSEPNNCPRIIEARFHGGVLALHLLARTLYAGAPLTISYIPRQTLQPLQFMHKTMYNSSVFSSKLYKFIPCVSFYPYNVYGWNKKCNNFLSW